MLLIADHSVSLTAMLMEIKLVYYKCNT